MFASTFEMRIKTVETLKMCRLESEKRFNTHLSLNAYKRFNVRNNYGFRRHESLPPVLPRCAPPGNSFQVGLFVESVVIGPIESMLRHCCHLIGYFEYAPFLRRLRLTAMCKHT